MGLQKNSIIAFTLSVGLCCSCDTELRSGYEGEYFNLDSVMSSQYEILIKDVNLIERTIQKNGVLNNYSYAPDQSELAEELNVLFEIDPNHPDYQGHFEKTKKKYRIGYAEIYSLREGIDLPFKSLEITRFDDGTIDEIKGVIEEKTDELNSRKKYVFIEFWKGRLDKFQIIEGKKVDGDTSSYSSVGLLGFTN